MAQPTAYEQYMLELINRARLDPAGEASRSGIDLNQDLSAGKISTAAKQPLAFNPLLIDSARGHSQWMVDTDTFSHTGSGGSSAGDRMASAGYQFTGSYAWGENIAMVGSRKGIDMTAATETLHANLFKSAGHRVNMLNDTYREAGIGTVSGPWGTTPSAVTTENFAKSGTSPFLTGVAFTDRDGDKFYDPGEGWSGVKVEMRSSGTVLSTTTWDAGGYQIQAPAGNYTVTFSGDGLASPVAKSVSIGQQNVKLDLDGSHTGNVEAVETLNGTSGADTLTGHAGPDLLKGLDGNDSLSGGDGADRLYGGSGSDALDGGIGADKLYGGANNDKLSGAAGNDILVGGPGSDILNGADGADRFTFWSPNDRGDIIQDFNAAAGNQLDLSVLFDRIGYAGASPVEDGYLRFLDTADGVHVDLDSNGGGDAFATLVTLTGSTVSQLGMGYLMV